VVSAPLLFSNGWIPPITESGRRCGWTPNVTVSSLDFPARVAGRYATAAASSMNESIYPPVVRCTSPRRSRVLWQMAFACNSTTLRTSSMDPDMVPLRTYMHRTTDWEGDCGLWVMARASTWTDDGVLILLFSMDGCFKRILILQKQ
jgi:hypothetical protein